MKLSFHSEFCDCPLAALDSRGCNCLRTVLTDTFLSCTLDRIMSKGFFDALGRPFL